MQGTNSKKKLFPVKRLILCTPTKEQLDDPRNLFAIVWKIRQLLVEAGYSESSIRHYTSEGLNVILLLFMCFASILTVASAILLYANTFGIRITEDKVNAADLFIVSERDLDGTEERQESIIEWFNNRDDIVDVELGQTIVFNPNAVDFESVDEDAYSTIVNGRYYAFDLSSDHDKVTDMDGNFFDLPYGTIAVPQ